MKLKYLGDGSYEEFLPADKYVNKFIEEAVYYQKCGSSTKTLSPSKRENIKSGHEWGFYEDDDGNVYEVCYTNKYENLVKFFDYPWTKKASSKNRVKEKKNGK